MKYCQNLFPLLVLLLSISVTRAQVKFKLQLLEDSKTYQVSLVPETSYRPPMNMTSTAQVTIKVPTGSFEVINLKNMQPYVEWQANSKAHSPMESAEYDYLSFGLLTNGTDYLRYEEGLELPLFTFENSLECTGEVVLMDNKEDPFSPPNSAQKNVGNQITIVGAQGDAYTGNLVKSSVPCVSLSTGLEEIDPAVVDLSLYPNPVIENIHISLDWNRPSEVESVSFSIFNIQGQQVITQKMNIQNGSNLYIMDVHNLSPGTYLLEISGADWKLNSAQFIKMEK